MTKLKKKADQPSGRLVVRMPRSLHARLTDRAEEENVSLNHCIVYLLAASIGEIMSARVAPALNGDDHAKPSFPPPEGLFENVAPAEGRS